MVRAGNIADAGNGFPVNYVAPPQALLDLYQWRVQNGTPVSSNPGVQNTSDFITKGTEIEIMFRPTRGLSFVRLPLPCCDGRDRGRPRLRQSHRTLDCAGSI